MVNKSKVKSKSGIARYIAVPLICLLLAFGLSYGLTHANKSGDESVASACDGTCVALNKGVATPDSISVEVGTYVQFNNNEDETRNLSLGKADAKEDEAHGHSAATLGSFVSGDFKKGEAWRVQFKEKGTYKFYDRYNPELSVLVVAYVPGGEYKVE